MELLVNLLRELLFKIYCFRTPIIKKILFLSFNGKQYSDNPRAISEKMHELYTDYEIVWYLKQGKDDYGIIPDYVRVVDGRWRCFLKELASAACFVSNTEMKDNIYKRKGQYFVQTWHADRAFKKVLLDVNPLRTIKDSKLTDCAVAASDMGELIYRTAFNYKGKVTRVGMPRNDCLVCGGKDISLIKKKLNIKNNKKILLYAPTFRDNNMEKNQEAYLDIVDILDHLSRKGEEWVCLLRAHPNVSCFESFNDLRAIEASSYPDIADLLLISDLLITDYSSCAGDFILRKKGVILYHGDVKHYNSNCREFKFNAKDAGFLIAENVDDLFSILDKYTDIDYEMNCKKIMRYFNINETGKSSEYICHIIYSNISNSNI